MKKLRIIRNTSLLLGLIAIALASYHHLVFGLVALLAFNAIYLQFALRSRLGIYSSIAEMEVVQKIEVEHRLHLFKTAPHTVCQYCGKPLKKHKLDGELVKCPEVGL